MIPAEVLRKKRDGITLTSEEIHFLIEGIVANSITQAQAAAFLMASCIRGLDKSEVIALTRAMAHCGRRYAWDHLGYAVDKHSTGGVGDKLSLLVAPLAAACGALVPMMSGRALGHTGGTIDKLESIAGFRVQLDREHIEKQLQAIGVVMIAQSRDLAPADRILYAIRDETGTVESDGLITASILSKKVAEGTRGLVLDVKVGHGALMQNIADAQRLARLLHDVGTELGLDMYILMTNMDDPLGFAVGNWVEVDEANRSLRSIEDAPQAIRELTVTLVSVMLVISGIADDLMHGRTMAEHRWRSGAAYETFHRMISSQGGNWEESVNRYRNIPNYTVTSYREGYVVGFETRQIGLIMIELGAGRYRQTDSVDPAAGVVFHVKRGDYIYAGQPLATCMASDWAKVSTCAQQIGRTIKISDQPPQYPTFVIHEIGKAGST